MSTAKNPAALYKLLPRKVGGFYVVVLMSDEGMVQFRSLAKANCQDWLNDNEPTTAADRLNVQAGAQVWRARPEAA